MSQAIQIVDENDNPIKSASKQEAWDQGLRHRVIRIMIANDSGELLLQHRSPTKDIFPDCWDNSVAGHVDVGEDYNEAALRELKEELGLDNVHIQEIGTYASSEVWQGHIFNRFTKVYQAHSNLTPATLEEGKVDGVQWFTLSQIKSLLRDTPEKASDGLRQVIERYY